ncbi:MAG: methylated-DNA--[protein]-cysteine S-methyltransferase [Myxococcota bacterium]
MSKMETLFATRFETPIGPLRIVSSDKGLAFVELPHASGRGFAGWQKTHAPDARVVDRRTAHEDAIDQLLEYTEGARRGVRDRPRPARHPFQRAVYGQVAKIGWGETLSYSDIAESIGRPTAVRAVGAANGANPIPLVIPCHRVIARGGALQGYAGGLELKARLLAMEQALPPAPVEQPRLF